MSNYPPIYSPPEMLTREQIEAHLFGRATKRETETILTSARWIDPERLRAAALRRENSPFYFGNEGRDNRAVFLGTLPDVGESPSQGTPVGWSDNRHIVTVAGSRAGKGQSMIIPNLHLYRGSVVCIDPKGENALATAEIRADWHGQEVFVLDPFKVRGEEAPHLAQFNPLATIDLYSDEAIETVQLIADSLVVQSNDKDAHWDESARSLLEALILFVLVEPRMKEKTLVTVRDLLQSGDLRAARRARISEVAWVSHIWFPPQAIPDADLNGFDFLLKAMASNQHPRFGPIISGQANSLLSMGPEERGGVLSFARRSTKFIDGKPMSDTLSSGGRQLDFRQLKAAPNGVSVYVVLPARYMATHARWLRMLVNCMIVTIEKYGPKTQDPRNTQDTPPVLAILDEFPVLGYMKLIETAIGYIAGYGLQIWSIVQDLSQLKRHYPDSWETFMGNAGLRQFFGNTDDTTHAYISKQLGETEIEVISQNSSSSQTDTTSSPSAAEKSRLLREFSVSGASDDGRLFESGSKQSGSTDGYSSQTTRAALLTPDEVARLFSRESLNQLVLFSGMQPARLKRVEHYRLGESAEQLDYWWQLVR